MNEILELMITINKDIQDQIKLVQTQLNMHLNIIGEMSAKIDELEQEISELKGSR